MVVQQNRNCVQLAEQYYGFRIRILNNPLGSVKAAQETLSDICLSEKEIDYGEAEEN